MKRSLMLGVTVITAVALLTACASSDNEPTTSEPGAQIDVTEFETVAQSAMAPVAEWNGPTSGPTAQSGVRVMWISCGLAAEGCKVPADGALEAGKLLGWDVTVVDGQFDPAVYNRSISEAIDQHYDAVVLGAVSSEAVSSAVKRAREAGIIVGSWDSLNEPSDSGVSFEADQDVVAQGEAMASYLIASTDGAAKAHVMYAPEFKQNSTLIEGVQNAFDKCATCEIVKLDQFVSGEADSRLPTLAVTTLNENPAINLTISSYDASLLGVVPALESAGLADRTQIVGFNGISPMLSFIAEGRATATVSAPQAWGAWATMDNINRLVAGEEPVEQNVPFRLFATENIDQITLGNAYEGDYDFRSDYAAIWGLN